MQRIKQDIRDGHFSNIYLLTYIPEKKSDAKADEPYLRKKYTNMLKDALVSSGDTMNLTVFSGSDINIPEAINIAGTMPFFAPRRVLVFEDTGIFKIADDDFISMVERLPDTTYLIFSESDIDRRGRLYKAVASKGYIAGDMGTQDETVLRRWISGELEKANTHIAPDAFDLLIKLTNCEMSFLNNELEKLIMYKYESDSEITTDDVNALCSVRLQDKIFDMVEAISSHRREEALNLYYDLVSLKIPPSKTLALISRHFNQLLQVRELLSKGYNQADIASRTKIHPYVAKIKTIPQAKKFTLEQLRQALRICVEADEAYKTGKIQDMLSVELVIVELSAA